jgi:hypothetical protein
MNSPTSNAEKTLGQLLYDSMFPRKRSEFDWETEDAQARYEAAAQAVRASVIEECAKVCEGQVDPEWPSDDVSLQALQCANAIRSLK